MIPIRHMFIAAAILASALVPSLAAAQSGVSHWECNPLMQGPAGMKCIYDYAVTGDAPCPPSLIGHTCKVSFHSACTHVLHWSTTSPWTLTEDMSFCELIEVEPLYVK